MKKVLKWIAIIFVGLIVIGALMPDEEETTKTSTETEATATAEEPAEEATTEEAEAPAEEEAKEEPAEDKDAGKMTKDKFDQIKNGMTYEEVVAVVGGEGNLLSEVGAEGEEFYTVMYEWEGASFASNANVTFQGSPAVVEMKAQFGLE